MSFPGRPQASMPPRPCRPGASYRVDSRFSAYVCRREPPEDSGLARHDGESASPPPARAWSASRFVWQAAEDMRHWQDFPDTGHRRRAVGHDALRQAWLTPVISHLIRAFPDTLLAIRLLAAAIELLSSAAADGDAAATSSTDIIIA